MNKKIKVIELLNKIYENLDVPKRVKLGEIEYLYSEIHEDYYNKGFEKFLFSHLAIHKINWLNIELEILEDTDEGEIDIENLEEIKGIVAIDEKGHITGETFIDFVNKINDLVKAVKQLDKKINKED